MSKGEGNPEENRDATPSAVSTSTGLLHSAGAATFSSVWRMLVTFGTHALLKTFIFPAEMAVWIWAEPLFLLIAQVRDLGVPAHVVRQEKRLYGNYLGLQLSWGGLLAIFVAFAAPILALLFEGRDANTVPILRALCVFLFIQGLSSVPLTFFEAEQRIVRTIPAELGRNTLFAILALTLAWRGHGIWSLVIAHIAAAALYTVMLWVAAWRGRPERDEEPMPLRTGTGTFLGNGWLNQGARHLAIAGMPLMLLSILELSVLNLEPLLLGGVVPAEALGLAGHAILLLYLVSRQVADACGRAVYPALVRFRQAPETAYEIFTVATVFLATLVTGAAFGLYINAELAVLLMAGGETAWLGATDYLRLGAFVPFLRPLTMFGREFLLVVHKDRLLIAYTLLNLLSIGGLGLLLTKQNGALGMAAAAYFPLGTLLLAWGLHQLAPGPFWALIRRLLEVYTLGLVCFLPVLLWPPESLWVRLVASLGLAGVFVALALFRNREIYRRFFALR